MPLKKRNSVSAIRQSVTLPPSVAEHVRKIAVAKRLSANQVLVDLVEAGIQAREKEKVRFMALAEELANCKNARRQSEIKQELALLTFGE
jgi:hypothetical protein